MNRYFLSWLSQMSFTVMHCSFGVSDITCCSQTYFAAATFSELASSFPLARKVYSRAEQLSHTAEVQIFLECWFCIPVIQ